MMRTDQIIDAVQSQLQHRFRLAGRGSVQRVQEQLQLGAGYFRDLRRPGRQRFDLRVLLEALQALGVDEAEFFASVVGTTDPVDTFRVEGNALRRRLRRLPRILRIEAERTCGNGSERVDLEALEADRLDQPRQVMRRACQMVRVARIRQVPRLLGIYASAARALGRLDEAQVVLCRALDLAMAAGDRKVVGELIQRSSYVLADRSDLDQALVLAERASSEFVAEGDLIGIGKTLVDRSVWHRAADQPEEALRLLRSALRYLPADCDRLDVRKNRFACWVNLGVVYAELGEPRRAGRFLRMARREASGLGMRVLAGVLKLDASIARQNGDNERAAELLAQALPIFQEFEPLDAAFIAVDLARLQLLLGRTLQATETAKSMTLLLKPLSTNRIASAAITELVRVALAGEGLNAAILDRVAKGLAKGRERQASRSR